MKHLFLRFRSLYAYEEISFFGAIFGATQETRVYNSVANYIKKQWLRL